MLALLGAGLIGLRAADRWLFGSAKQTRGPLVSVTIPAGSGLHEIAGVLEQAGVVGSAGDFELHAFGAADLKAGIYRIRQHESYEEILAILRAGPPARPTKKLVIPEGLAVRDMAQLVPKVGLGGAAYEAVAKKARPPDGFLGADEPAATIEGFLFPATYDVQQPPTAEELVAQQLEAFSATFAKVDLTYAKSRNLTAYDVLKIASLIEREAAYSGDRAKIAAVIYNRLHAGMTLGIDATIQYAVGAWRPLKARDLEIDSPFNSRVAKGLPPTPICSPGLASLEAAAHPSRKRKYLYYVAIPGDKKRRHFFTDSYAAFLQFQKDHPA